MRGTYRLNTYLRQRLVQQYRRFYTGPTPTLLCNNCTGAMMLHDLGLRFNSPFVNLWLEPADFLYLCANPSLLLSSPVEPCDSDLPYPVGQIDGRKIFFQHYDSFKQAKEIWERRVARMDMDNLSVLFVYRENTSASIHDTFYTLPVTHKAMLLPEGAVPAQSAICLPRATARNGTLKILTDYSGLLGYRYYDEFDFPRWLTDGSLHVQ